MMVYEILVNKVKYIPVAVATLASSPTITRIGQNIIPSPIPQNTETKAPNHPININIETFKTFSLRSPGTNLYSQSIF